MNGCKKKRREENIKKNMKERSIAKQPKVVEVVTVEAWTDRMGTRKKRKATNKKRKEGFNCNQ